MDEFKIGKPTVHRPEHGGNRGGHPVSKRNQAIIDACAELGPNEFLPVEFGDADAAHRLVAIARNRTTSLGKAGLRVAQRGATVYFSRNGTH